MSDDVFFPDESHIVETSAADADTRACPFCGQTIKRVALKCRHCRRMLGDPDGPGVFRDGKKVVLSRDGVLPQRCFKTNVPTINGVQRTVHRYSPWALLALLLSPLIYILVAIATRKKASVHLFVSDVWMKRRRKRLALAWMLLFLGIVAFVGGGAAIDPVNPTGMIIFFTGLIAMVAGLVYLVIAASIVSAARIEVDHVWLLGAHSDYLAELPHWPDV